MKAEKQTKVHLSIQALVFMEKSSSFLARKAPLDNGGEIWVGARGFQPLSKAASDEVETHTTAITALK